MATFTFALALIAFLALALIARQQRAARRLQPLRIKSDLQSRLLRRARR